jgi:hypothetical protein
MKSADNIEAIHCTHTASVNTVQCRKQVAGGAFFVILLYPSDQARQASGDRHVASSVLGVGQAEKQITRGRRDGGAVRTVGGGDGITARGPTCRSSQIGAIIQFAS